MREDKERTRKLSLWRLLVVVIILLALLFGVAYTVSSWKASQLRKANKPWFAAYVDVTATPLFPFQQMGLTNNKDAVLSFIVSSPNDPCTPTWGGAYTLDEANSLLDLDTRIARLQQQGGSIAISFGGRDHNELSSDCDDPTKLVAAYTAVVNRYKINTIDLDIEGAELSNADALSREAAAMDAMQSDRRNNGENLAIWLTLPTSPAGLTQDGTDAVSAFLSHGVDLAGVNVMTMDYGSSLTSDLTMLSASEGALKQTERQLSILYRKSGIYLSAQSLWSKVGATPMIGQNDDIDEVFTLRDAHDLNTFALSTGVGRISMWSANRDITCGSNYVDTMVVSDACSGVDESKQTFAEALSQGFNGSISLSAGFVTKSSEKQQTYQAPDNPATSPYQIWSPNGAYLEGTKVVWHHNVYQAKWWTQGDLPDNPVLQTWQTPWELIGPVIAGETPIPQPTLPSGTYPNWSGTAIYNAGQRVLLNGVPYQAKWWTQGDSPAAASSNPNGSPWVPLTQAQINDVEASLKVTLTATPTSTIMPKKN